MVVLDGNFALGCGPGTDYPLIHTFQRTLEWTDAITNEVIEPVTFILAYPAVLTNNKELKPSFGMQSMTTVKG